VKKVEMPNGEVVKIALTDTAGAEKFKSLSSMYFRGAKAIFFTYAINSRDSFNDVNSWIDEAMQKCDNSNYIGCIIANKLDLEVERQVSYEEGAELAASKGMHFLEVSAKSNTGIQDVFDDVIQQVLSQQERIEADKAEQQQQLRRAGLVDQTHSNQVDLNNSNTSQSGGYGCC
jgi:small GTP-binding protein